MGGTRDTYMGERKGAHRVSVGKHEGKNNLKDRGTDGQITEADIHEIGFEGRRVWSGFMWLRIGTSGRLL